MSHFPAIEELVPNQERLIRRMMALSLAAHAAVFLLGSALSPLFPPRQASPPVFVELTDAPMSELPEDPPAPPSQVSPAPPAASAEAAPRAALPDRPAAKENPAASAEAAPSGAVSGRPAAKGNPAARRWLEKLDAGTGNFPEAPIVRKEGRAGGIPVRTWTNEGPAKPGDFAPAVSSERPGTAKGPAKPGDFAPAVSSERSTALGKHLEELEARVRLSGRPAVGSGGETEASMMFGGTGTSGNEQIPPWIRDMVRKKVRGYLPELEAAYSAAIRRNPALKGKLIVRFRIDPSGKVPRAVPMESSFEDGAFIAVVLEKIRHWTFDPPAGRDVEVLYPFVFVAPG